MICSTRHTKIYPQKQNCHLYKERKKKIVSSLLRFFFKPRLVWRPKKRSDLCSSECSLKVHKKRGQRGHTRDDFWSGEEALPYPSCSFCFRFFFLPSLLLMCMRTMHNPHLSSGKWKCHVSPSPFVWKRQRIKQQKKGGVREWQKVTHFLYFFAHLMLFAVFLLWLEKEEEVQEHS